MSESVEKGRPWVDRDGDVWELGVDGLMHTPETRPFPRGYVERKWGPLRPMTYHRPADCEAPCCTACSGQGATLSGPCSDCYGTGHPHPTAEIDAADIALALRILSPGDEDTVTLGELRREFGINVTPPATTEADS